ncbi:hypothetical protein JOF36_005896 [Pseudonocardia parietis]|uniref:Uncharacterized protein n=1 Tax=Pseudonocardia parietis TaxID=570936 RepID=A0ABS4W1X3_9PSEU|nr:hypothetical protein [Pseudonocardia parietis]
MTAPELPDPPDPDTPADEQEYGCCGDIDGEQ